MSAWKDHGRRHDQLETAADSALLPEDALLVSEQSEMIERMIRNLPEVFQQVVRLIDLEGLDYQDAAKILDLPLGTVKSRLTRARLKMRSLFEQSRLL
jgi:RNA polymerase sigma-70 factor, ECF subfamily